VNAPVPALARTFDPTPTSVRAARKFVVEACDAADADAAAANAALLVSELVTNAVLHARTEFTVEITFVRDAVRVAVLDRSSVVPAIRTFSAMAGSGRGLHLVDTMATRWGVDDAADGKAVWFEVPVADDPTATFDFDSADSL
jgi:anti-sigma regulatory factor (Ser/Thr protein kinase)